MRTILTGATGMVGEGVLIEVLKNPKVTKVLVVGRKHCKMSHPKLEELIVPDFLKVEEFSESLNGYDACFYCAGISSVGMRQEEYSKITYDTTLVFAKTVLRENPSSVFIYVSGQGTDGSESGRLMWARVKGKTENDLMRMGFKGQYNFRAGIMIPFKEQNNAKLLLRTVAKLAGWLVPRAALPLSEVGTAMIHVVKNGYPKQILEVSDIKNVANEANNQIT